MTLFCPITNHPHFPKSCALLQHVLPDSDERDFASKLHATRYFLVEIGSYTIFTSDSLSSFSSLDFDITTNRMSVPFFGEMIWTK